MITAIEVIREFHQNPTDVGNTDKPILDSLALVLEVADVPESVRTALLNAASEYDRWAKREPTHEMADYNIVCARQIRSWLAAGARLRESAGGST